MWKIGLSLRRHHGERELVENRIIVIEIHWHCCKNQDSLRHLLGFLIFYCIFLIWLFRSDFPTLIEICSFARQISLVDFWIEFSLSDDFPFIGTKHRLASIYCLNLFWLTTFETIFCRYAPDCQLFFLLPMFTRFTTPTHLLWPRKLQKHPKRLSPF